MAISQGLELKQQQQLVMTPQLQQSIKLLQMSTLDLQSYVEQQLAENPLLEVSGLDDDTVSLESINEDIAGENELAGDTGFLENSNEKDSAEWGKDHQFSDDSGLDTGDMTNWSDGAAPGMMQEAGYWDAKSGTGSFEGTGNLLEQTVAGEQSLQEHLREQWQMDCDNPVQLMVGVYLIDALDEAGYLREPLDKVAETLGCSVEMAEETLLRLQQCDPVGIAARSLEECLALQLKDKDHLDPAMERLLQHLDVLGQGDMKVLGKHCGVDAEDIADMVAEIRALNPKPGQDFAHEPVHAVKPDVSVARQGEKWHIELIQDQLPKVLVDKRYYSTVAAQARSDEDKQYLSDHLSQANWLVKSLDQRARTILAVATEIVARQEMFFKHGVRHLKPLTLKTVADAIGMHESTVSRVTTQKYMMTSRGIFELKYFFTSGVQTESGLDMSSEAVKAHIRELVDHESPTAILSDDKLTELLQDKGIDVARRTVAKYREAMHIGSSVERRRQKRLQG